MKLWKTRLASLIAIYCLLFVLTAHLLEMLEEWKVKNYEFQEFDAHEIIFNFFYRNKTCIGLALKNLQRKRYLTVF